MKIRLSLSEITLAVPDGYAPVEGTHRTQSVGSHEVCGGTFFRRPISVTHTALVCDRCGYQFQCPLVVENLEQLKLFASVVLARQEEGKTLRIDRLISHKECAEGGVLIGWNGMNTGIYVCTRCHLFFNENGDLMEEKEAARYAKFNWVVYLERKRP